MPASDATLVLGVLDGDQAAFAELYDRRARLIRAICYDQTGELAAAADLTQEVFLRAWRNLARLRDVHRFTPWLVGIARQTCGEWRRARRRATRTQSAWQEQAARPSAAESPDARLVDLRDEIAGLLDEATGPMLSDNERLALHAYYLQERDVEEARHVLGLSKSGFYRVLATACERLRSHAERREVQP